MITPDMIKNATFRLVLHAKLAKGGFVYQTECVEFPRLAMVKSRADSKSPVERELLVDGKPITFSAQAAADALNAPQA